MTIEAMKLALDALEAHADIGIKSDKAITAIRTAIEQSEKQEPVAWVRKHELPLAPGDAFSWVETRVHKTPLYTTPPAAQWVGLDREIAIAVLNHCYGHTAISADMIDRTTEVIKAKLKEKNHG
jgi:hypothetical protein